MSFATLIPLILMLGMPMMVEARTDPSHPLVIAHRGASGERPEHTRAAYDLAIDQGADFIEPDLVMSRDGVLVVRHENEISGTTDVADHSEFADRKKTRTIDGQAVTGWFTEDFSLAELKTLRARERLPQLRPGNVAYDGQEPILTFQDVIDIARAGSERTGRTIGVAPELKHPSYFTGAGLDMVPVFVAALTANGLTGPEAPVLVQCFEVGTLKRLAAEVRTPLLQLMAPGGGPFDEPSLTYADMANWGGLLQVATYATAIGVETGMILPRDGDNRTTVPTALVQDAHDAGLVVVAWTFRAENLFLAQEDRRGDPADPGYMAAYGDLIAMLDRFYAQGVDAVFSDFPEIAVGARQEPSN